MYSLASKLKNSYKNISIFDNKTTILHHFARWIRKKQSRGRFRKNLFWHFFGNRRLAMSISKEMPKHTFSKSISGLRFSNPARKIMQNGGRVVPNSSTFVRFFNFELRGKLLGAFGVSGAFQKVLT